MIIYLGGIELYFALKFIRFPYRGHSNMNYWIHGKFLYKQSMIVEIWVKL